MTKTLTIYDMENLPNPERVRMALKEKRAIEAVDFVKVDIFEGEHRSDDFAAINPDQAIPCLQLDDGTTISRCTAITEYIDGVFDGPSLIGDTPAERAATHMMNLRAEEGLVDAVGGFFHHATPGLGPDIEIDQVPAWGERQKKRAQNTMRYFDQVLEDRDWLAGDRFSMADITAFTGMNFAEAIKFEIPDGLDNLAAWRNRVAARYVEQ